MTRRWPLRSRLLLSSVTVALLVVSSTITSAQVATLRTPDPDAAATQAPIQDVDDQEAVLAFAACMRENGIDFPDPRFGVGGGLFGGGLAGLDFMSSDFLDAMESCQSFLSALQPELNPEQQAEQREQEVAFARCMREQGLDFPDPDPTTGFSLGAFRGDDGGLVFDPFSSEFLVASSTCIQALSLDPAGSPEATDSQGE